MIAEDQVTVLDVNSRKSWLKAHVPGAFNLDPTNYDKNDLSPEKESNLVFYCSNPMCRKAPGAAHRAKKMGYIHAKVMPAGINGWISAGLLTERGEKKSRILPIFPLKAKCSRHPRPTPAYSDVPLAAVFKTYK